MFIHRLSSSLIVVDQNGHQNRTLLADNKGSSTSTPTTASALVNQLCPRTGLTPLHKAVQEDDAIAVQLLLDARADMFIKCALYDDDTPLALAQRLRLTNIVTLLMAQQSK
jgi:hypothetical protein